MVIVQKGKAYLVETSKLGHVKLEPVKILS